MHCIDDRANGIVLNHSTHWNSEVRVAWYLPDERRERGPTPPSLRECWCVGEHLVAGRFTHLRGTEPPLDVITRAVALAVEAHLRLKMERALEETFEKHR